MGKSKCKKLNHTKYEFIESRQSTYFLEVEPKSIDKPIFYTSQTTFKNTVEVRRFIGKHSSLNMKS